MLDIRLLRETPDVVKADLEKRGRDPTVVDSLLGHDADWRDGLKALNDQRAARNSAAKAIAEAKKSGGDGQAEIEAMGQVSAEIKRLEAAVDASEAARDAALRSLPNIMHASVPVGDDETENAPLRTWGEAVANPDGVSHVDLLESLDLADTQRAARAAGSRFVYLKGDLVLLGKALEFYALQKLRAKGFTAIEPPFMLRREAIEGAVDLSDFEDVIYRVEAGKAAGKEDAPELFLIATSEHPLAAMHMGEILDSNQMPLRYAGVSPCFRKEAGAHGKDQKGIFRVHQFSKVEQFVYCSEEDSWAVHDQLIANAEEMYQELEIPYRVVNICTGDLGTVAAKKYDIEAWMPVQGNYREVVSCSNCTDYQARRYNTRHRPKPSDPTMFVHTLNSTAIAVQRTLVAILENFQNPDGSVTIPKVLQPLMGVDRLVPGRLMFKRRNPDKPRDDMASRALAKLREAEADNKVASDAFEAGRAAEAAEDDEAALAAYMECIEAWGRRHEATGHGVSHEPFERMAIILRRAKEPYAEVGVLQRYMAQAGRDAHHKLAHRLERAEELADLADQAAAAEDED